MSVAGIKYMIAAAAHHVAGMLTDTRYSSRIDHTTVQCADEHCPKPAGKTKTGLNEKRPVALES